MRRTFFLVIFGLGLGAAIAAAQDEPLAFDAGRAKTFRSAPGRTLTGPSSADRASVVARFLRDQRERPATVDSLRTTSQGASRGLTNVHMEQHVAGLRVPGAYVKASLDGSGRLLHLIENLADVSPAGILPPRVDERQALRAALRSVYPAMTEDPTVTSMARSGNVTTFAKTTSFVKAPTVERVAIATTGGVLRAGFEVETWTKKGNLLHYTLVGGDGRVLAVELRTNTDKYNVFRVDPDAAAQVVVDGPGSGNAESPAGWLAGAQRSVNIGGNNVHAYLDTDANNTPDPGGAPVTNGEFLTGAHLDVSPSTGDNREVAIQNLFYLNNVLHDTLYDHGFNEAAGNFQENNFGNGGKDSDSVDAEGQDGGSIDNANFATPHDGQNPRMQMFLWTGKGDHEVVVGAATYPAQGAGFGPPLDATGVTGPVLLAHDGAGASDTDGCEAITTDLTGSIAVMDRGTCGFVVKVKNAQLAGAVGAIIANHLGDSIFTMGGADATINIPSVFIGLTSGNALKATLPAASGTIRLTDPPPLQRDGDLDSDIVYHEYGHGLTWRMIGRMAGPMSGAIGEGMSDVLAVILNENDVVGEYAFNDPLGIRTFPYHDYPRTYVDVTGSEVHFDGEVYGAIGWRLFEIFSDNGIPKDTLLDYIVDGMNFTPAGPTFEDMRDGILQSVTNSGSGDECLVWDAFAQYGVGVGAKGVVKGNVVQVTQSFALPPQCSAP